MASIFEKSQPLVKHIAKMAEDAGLPIETDGGSVSIQIGEKTIRVWERVQPLGFTFTSVALTTGTRIFTPLDMLPVTCKSKYAKKVFDALVIWAEDGKWEMN